MIEFKRGKKNRSKNALFNPYKNGISSYDMAFLSSKNISELSFNFAMTNLFDLLVKEETNIEISSISSFLSSILAEVETLI